MRCAGFQPGNAFARDHGRPVEHGAYSKAGLSARAEELTAWIYSMGPHLTPADEVTVRLLAFTYAAFERAVCAVGTIDEALEEEGERPDLDRRLDRLERRGRINAESRRERELARRLAFDLGLSAAGRAALEAAQQPPGIPPAEVAALFAAFTRATLAFVDRSRSDEFLARIRAVSAPYVGELPAAGETTDRDEGGKP